MSVSPRLAGAVGILALIPVAIAAVGKYYIAAIALVNVALITYALYLMMSPHEGGHDHDHGAEPPESSSGA